MIVKSLDRVEGIDTFTAAIQYELGGPGRAQQGTRGVADPRAAGPLSALRLQTDRRSGGMRGAFK